MQDAPKAVWIIPYVSVVFFPSLKHNFMAYHSSKMSDCIFEIPLLWKSGFRRVYSNCCCSCSFGHEIIKIGQSSHNMYSNNILNFEESTIILNACTKKRMETYWKHHVHDQELPVLHPMHHHQHHLEPPARISLTLSRHSFLSFIASGRSSGLHPVSSQSCCM